MTKKDLERVSNLKKEIGTLEHKIKSLREQTMRVTSTITDMPKGSSKDETKELLVDTITFLENCKRVYEVEVLKIEKYIFSVEDPLIKSIIRYRFIDNLTWTAVALRVGGSHSADSVRKALDRFLQKVT